MEFIGKKNCQNNMSYYIKINYSLHLTPSLDWKLLLSLFLVIFPVFLFKNVLFPLPGPLITR